MGKQKSIFNLICDFAQQDYYTKIIQNQPGIDLIGENMAFYQYDGK